MALPLLNNIKSQRGAALLLFMLALILASSYSLLSKLNPASKIHARDLVTNRALAEAKAALISYAVIYPDRVNSNFGPGYLPCPDINNNGSAGGSCSFAGKTTIGRFPWVTLKMNDLKDSSGQSLWYALSDNFKYNQKIEPLNSETEGQLNIDVDADGDIDGLDIDDIVAIVIAPGEPVGNQSRDIQEFDIADEITNYLEAENADIGVTFDVDFVTIDAGDFNDKIIAITRQELMEQVEKRVLGEVSQFLTEYLHDPDHDDIDFNSIDDDNNGVMDDDDPDCAITPYDCDDTGAYPWLTSFSDPKTIEKRIVGEHSGAVDQDDLTDASVDFIQWGVAIDDVVWNITDGSYGTVTGVAATTLTIGGGLGFGTENKFDTDDEYFVDITAITTAFIGSATASNALVLTDATKDFTKLDIQLGNILENTTDGSSGIVNDISATQLTVKALTGGALNTFTINDNYQIRTSMGRATVDTDSNGLTLEDTTVDFTVMGIQAGDLIRNITDDSYGRITNVAANSLTVSELLFGTNNTFAEDDYFSLPRFNNTTNTREGLLSFQESGEAFKTNLTFDWTITVDTGDVTFDLAAFPGVQVTYRTAIENYLQTYGASGAITSNDSIGTCLWSVPDIADCYSGFTQNINISGTVTSGSNTSVLTDTSATFLTDGVKHGDIVQNYDDEFATGVLGTIDAGTRGIATGGSSGLVLEDTNNNFTNLEIKIGDTISNISDGSSGTVALVTATSITASSLTSGTDNDFDTGDIYQVQTLSKLYDVANNFNSSNIEAYQYLIHNSTTGIRAVITDVNNNNSLTAVEFDNQASSITFSPGDNYTIYTPGIVVVTSVPSETVSNTTQSGVYNPDFDLLGGPYEEYYRILTAANSYSSNSTNATSSATQLDDSGADFMNDGVSIGDIIENVGDGSFGEITAVTPTSVTVNQLYGGAENDFDNSEAYNIYHDYVYSRKHILHTRFKGDQVTNIVSQERVRDVCIGYTTDCSATSIAVNFSGNGGVSLVTLRDYESNGTTEVGRASFTPTASSSGSLRVSNIEFNLHTVDVDLDGDGDYSDAGDIEPDFPEWFINNDWHKLVYISFSAGDAPGAVAVCVEGTDCLTINNVKLATPNNVQSTSPNDNIRSLAIIAGMETNKILDSDCTTPVNTTQDRTNGTINEYYESNNCDQADDVFQEQLKGSNFNDQAIVIDSL